MGVLVPGQQGSEAGTHQRGPVAPPSSSSAWTISGLLLGFNLKCHLLREDFFDLWAVLVPVFQPPTASWSCPAMTLVTRHVIVTCLGSPTRQELLKGESCHLCGPIYQAQGPVGGEAAQKREKSETVRGQVDAHGSICEAVFSP